MKQPGTVVHRGGHEYLLLEGGFNEDTRAVHTLVRPDNPLFPRPKDAVPVRWLHQGEWFPVARWSADGVTFGDTEHTHHAQLVSGMVEAYLRRRPPAPNLVWAASRNDSYAGTLERVLPAGLAVTLFEKAEDAAATAEDATVVPVSGVARFLAHLVQEGYAGALWHGTLPVFFCTDDQGDLQFLRLIRSAPERVQLETLDANDRWVDYEGEAELDFLDNRDACDRRLRLVLGGLPILDWPEDGRLWAVGPSAEQVGIVTSEDGSTKQAVLFSSQGTAHDYCGEVQESWTDWPVADLPGFLKQDALKGMIVMLNPGEHRARGGLLWCDGERTVLDSFSGFWKLTGPKGFELLG